VRIDDLICGLFYKITAPESETDEKENGEAEKAPSPVQVKIDPPVEEKKVVYSDEEDSDDDDEEDRRELEGRTYTDKGIEVCRFKR
jgi:hypothetical protein